jgi:hypothetical protein
MIQSDHHRRQSLLLSIHCFSILLLLLPQVSTQICQNDIPDFFYNVSFAGPIFDQGVYAIQTPRLSVNAPLSTTVFSFTVRPQNDSTRPSFISTSISGRALNNSVGILSVTSSDPSFRVQSYSNGTYSLLTNTAPLNYFSPYNRYSFNLIATQGFANRPPVSSTAIVQIDLENYNVHAPIFVPASQTFSISETASVGSIIGTVYATDADNDTIFYSLTHSNFAIDPYSGVLRLLQGFTTSTAQYPVNVTAKDEGSSCGPITNCPTFTTQGTITINVTAVNKRSPSFLNNICGSNVSFYEGNANGSNVTTLVAFDNDRGENGQITISFPSEQSRTTGDISFEVLFLY